MVVGRRQTASFRQCYLIWGFFCIIQVTDSVFVSSKESRLGAVFGKVTENAVVTKFLFL